MITVLDVETTTYNKDPSPYIPQNKLVSVGYKSEDINEYLCFNHNQEPYNPCGPDYLQEQLDMTTLLVCHNVKFDLSWLWACGFTYKGDTYDTMIYEYLKAGGTNVRLDLSSCCKRYAIPVKDDVVQEYLNDGVGFEAMPWEVVEQYGRHDVDITWKLYHAQLEDQ